MASVIRISVCAALWLALAVSVPARIPGRQLLPGHVPAAVARLHPIGNLPETHSLNLAIGLPLRHQDELNRFLRDLSDPASPRYRRFLKPQEFADQFGPSEADYQALIGFAMEHHLRVLRTHSNRVLLDVAASAAQVRDTFHIKLKVYRHPSEDRTFYAPEEEPSVDLDVPVLHVSGLDNYVLPRPQLRTGRNGGSPPWQSGSGTNGTYLGNDFRAAYAPGVALTGAGQSVALVEFDTYYTNDILGYERLAGIPPVPITNVIVDGFHGPPEGGEEEAAADIEMAVAMAPGLSQVLVYEAPYDDSSVNNDLLNQIAVDNLAHQISCSWFFYIDGVTDQIFQEMAAQGQSFFNACGDSGAYYADMAAKEGDPYITQVGGAELTTSGPGGTWKAETAWLGGSGGVSATYPIPYWQQTVNMSSNQGSTVWRNVPDVALTSAMILLVFDNGTTNGQAGTSCSTPLWAGFTALVNEQAAQNGRPPVGFLNPAIYGIGQGSLYASCFHDITEGHNTNDVSTNKFFAVKGYDLCTGWGTPNGSNLINALAPPDNLILLPSGGLALALTNNGAAPGEEETLVLTNAGATSIAWSVGAVPSWIQFSATNGVVASGTSTSLRVTTTPGATNLLAGGYAADLALSNLTAGVAHAVAIFLAVSDPLILTPATGMAVSGPVGGPFNVTSQLISLSNAAAAPLSWTVSAGSVFLNIAPGSGTLAPGQVASVTATLSAAVSNLLINAASGGMAFADLATGITQTLPFTLAVGNGGFETGGFSDWTFAGHTNANFVAGAPLYLDYVHSGAFAAIFGEPTNLATLSQNLPTTAGQLYLISFWLDNPAAGNPNEFEATWNGGTLFKQTNMPAFLWTNMEFVTAATQAATTLEFFIRNEPAAFGLDDVSVTPIVPPAFSSVAASNGEVLFHWSTLPGFSYQLQYATNLAAPLWVNSGGPIAATNVEVAATDPAPVNPQRFYRVVMALP
jgi:subtilase family serine protease